MRKLIVSEFLSIDGVFETPGGEGEFEYSGWTSPYGGDEFTKFKYDELFAADALLLGRVTYEAFTAAWPGMTDEVGFADRMNNLPKFVVSTTLSKADWNNSTIVEDDVAGKVTELKQQDGQNILVFGSGTLVRSLMQYDLVDEYRLMVFPVVLGKGQRLFGGSPKTSLKLTKSQPFKTGVVVLTYKPEEPDKE